MSADIRRAALGGAGGTGVISRLVLALRVWDERRRLAEADEATLRDIGVSRGEAAREAGRSFWDLPAGRK